MDATPPLGPTNHPGGASATAPPPSPRSAFWIVAALLALVIEAAALRSGGDASWDLRNYHLYGPFALLHKPFGVDIAPAHLPTFLSPTLDLLDYGLLRTIGSVPLLNALLALPHAAAAILALALSWRLVRPRGWAEPATLGLLTALAATGVAAFSTLATSMSEVLPTAIVICALLVLIRPRLDTRPTPARLFAAGLLLGAACGLKLTLSYVVVALLLLLALVPRRRWSDLLTRPLIMGVGVFLGLAATTGYWWLYLWVHYGNPLFPFFNQVFRSPDARLASYADVTFVPHAWADLLSAPWSWALRLSWATGESRLRDPRFSIALLAALAALVSAAMARPRRRPWPVLLLPAWFVLSFALWRLGSSINRYLSVLELLIGVIVALAAFPVARRLRRPGLLLGASAALLAACAVVTVYPQIRRLPVGADRPVVVDLGPLPPDSMVLLLDNEPLAYLAAFADPRIRFLGTNDAFMTLDDANPLQPRVARAIAAQIARQAGPLYGLDAPDGEGDRGDRTLARYHLLRGPCRIVEANLSPFPIRLCRLSHD